MGELNRISIDVTEPGNVDRTAGPITQGVPFADGELAVDAPVRLVDEDGRALCPYILRMEMFAGRPEIRFSHTFVFDGDPERIEVNRLGVEIDLDLGEAEQMSFGGTEGATGDAQDVRIGPAGGMTPQLLHDVVKLFGDDNPIYQEALIAIADRYVYHVNDMYEVLDVDGHEQLDPYFNAAIVAYAYERTSRLDYAAYCRYYIREHFPERAQVMSFTYVCWGSIIPPMLAAVRHAEQVHGSSALHVGEAEWIEWVRRRSPEVTVAAATTRPERRNIGRITGYES